MRHVVNVETGNEGFVLICKVVEFYIITNFKIKFCENNIITGGVFQIAQSVLANGRSAVCVIVVKSVVRFLGNGSTVNIGELNHIATGIDVVVGHFKIEYETITCVVITI